MPIIACPRSSLSFFTAASAAAFPASVNRRLCQSRCLSMSAASALQISHTLGAAASSVSVMLPTVLGRLETRPISHSGQQVPTDSRDGEMAPDLRFRTEMHRTAPHRVSQRLSPSQSGLAMASPCLRMPTYRLRTTYGSAPETASLRRCQGSSGRLGYKPHKSRGKKVKRSPSLRLEPVESEGDRGPQAKESTHGRTPAPQRTSATAVVALDPRGRRASRRLRADDQKLGLQLPRQ